MQHVYWILGALAGYLCGSLSSAVIVCRLMGLPDPRTQGSGNPGATNVLRIGGNKAAAVTLLGDVLKGFIPVLLLRLWCGAAYDAVWLAAGLGAFFGHLYPLFFGFKGGKGVATAFGVLLAWSPVVALIVLGVWLAVFFESKISSLAALVAAFIAPIAAVFFTAGAKLPLAMLAMVAVLVYRHKANIQRLLRGEEDSFGKKKPRNDFEDDDDED